MNNIVTLSQLITRLAKATGTDTGTTRSFLRSFFSTIEQQLVSGQSVNIKGIGTFRRSEDPLAGAPDGVIFIPDKSLQEEINSRFGVFQPVEISDGVAEEDLLVPDRQPGPDNTKEPVADSEPEPENIQPATSGTETEEVMAAVSPAADERLPDTTEEEETETVHQAEPEQAEILEPEPAQAMKAEPELEPEPEKNHNRLFFWIAGIAIVIIGGALWMAIVNNPIPTVGEWDDEEEIISDPDTIAAPVIEEVPIENISSENEASLTAPVTKPEQVPDKTIPQAVESTGKGPVYDTVTSTNYLASMARKYYGSSVYWVYIYEANKDKLRHPDRIAPGTRVLIPDKNTIPAIDSPAEGRRLAEQKAKEIYARF